MGYSIQDIAAALGAEACGQTELLIDTLREPALSSRNDLALAIDPKYAADLARGSARAAILWANADWQALKLEAAILVARPRFAMATLTALLDTGPGFSAVIDPSAIIAKDAKIGKNVGIGALSVISSGAVIGDDSLIGPMCFVGVDATIGTNALLREGVKIAHKVQIGTRFVSQPGASIGGDGFSFVTPEISSVEQARKTLGDQSETAPQTWTRTHSLGSVNIGDDVEIGANSCVDRGTVGF